LNILQFDTFRPYHHLLHVDRPDTKSSFVARNFASIRLPQVYHRPSHHANGKGLISTYEVLDCIVANMVRRSALSQSLLTSRKVRQRTTRKLRAHIIQAKLELASRLISLLRQERNAELPFFASAGLTLKTSMNDLLSAGKLVTRQYPPPQSSGSLSQA